MKLTGFYYGRCRARLCNTRKEKDIIPRINVQCLELNDQIFGPQLEEKLRQCAEDIINKVDILEVQ